MPKTSITIGEGASTEEEHGDNASGHEHSGQ
jgi:hypothetical protein